MMKTPHKIVINEHLDMRMHDGKPTIFIDDRPFLACSFLVANLKNDDPNITMINSIDELADFQGTRIFEGNHGLYKEYGMQEIEILQAHASNIIAWVENGYDTRILHSNLAFPLLKKLARAGDAKAKRVLHAEIIERLKSEFYPTSMTIIRTCMDLFTSETWEIVARSRFREIRALAAQSFMTPKHVLLMLASDESLRVRHEVARNANAPLEALNILVKAGDLTSDLFIAENPNASAQLLQRFANDKRYELRLNVARNPKAPGKILLMLLNDPFQNVRLNVLRNPNLPRSEFEKIIKYADLDQRESLAMNPSLPEEYHEIFIMDDNESVRSAIALNPSLKASRYYERLSADLHVMVRRGIAKNPSTPRSILSKLAKDHQPVVRMHVAENPGTSKSDLRMLVDDKDAEVSEIANDELERRMGIEV